MTLWQNLCTYGLAFLQAVGLTSLDPLSDQSLSPQANINDNLPSFHHDHGPVDFGFGAQEDKKRPPPPPPKPLPWEKRFLPIKPTDLNFKTNNECNYPSDRKRWCFHQSINTDFEEVALVPNTGVTRNFTLILTSDNTFCGDGYCRPVMLINGQYPGPVIRGSWGDWFNITVINNMKNGNGSAIHWHGLRQFRSVWADGVPGVTQCPIPPGQSMSYLWRATQYGTSWYHSHFSLQYPDGIAGPLIIDGPSTTEFDEDKGPIMLTDWYHKGAFSIYYLETTQGPPQPQSVLINGMGAYSQVAPGSNNTMSIFACDPDVGPDKENCKPLDAGMYSTYIQYGKKYKLRLINTSATSHFSFWIEGHDFTIVATDFVPIEPYKVSYVNVAIGQRYEIILEAKTIESMKGKSPNFWVKMRSCDTYCVGDPCPGNSKCKYEECRQGIVSYDLKSAVSPDKNWRGPAPPSSRCRDPPRDKINPWVRRDLRGHIQDNLRFKSPFEVENQKGTQVPPGTENATLVNLWNIKFNDQESSFMIDWEQPTIKLVNDDRPINPRYVPIEIDGQDAEWTVFAIVSNWTAHGGPTSPHGTPLHAIPGAAHPIHLHGHDFVVLSQVENATARDATFDMNKSFGVDLFNPPRRDVVMLPADGYVIIAFRVDNPGTWLMHCHIAWHASAGLALQWIERRDDIPKLLKTPRAKGVMKQLDDQCRDWKKWYGTSVEKQEDSGV